MILFLNVFITDTTMSTVPNHCYYRRGLSQLYTSFDVFKYMLASFADIFPWQKVIIYSELDECYKSRQEELDIFIHSMFPNCFYSRTRLCRIVFWRDALLEHFHKINDNDLIWYMGNHDHIFIGYETSLLHDIVNYAKQNPVEYRSIDCTSWPEALLSYMSNTDVGLNTEIGFCSVFSPDVCATQIVNKKSLFIRFFDNSIDHNKHIPRSDEIWERPNFIHEKLIPLKELCRHFDGYGHGSMNDVGKCPGLIIPPNFWDNLRIRLYYDDIDKECVNVNPLKPYYSMDINGVDMKCVLDDIPIFWKKYIKEIDINPNAPDIEDLINARNNAHKNIAEMVCPVNRNIIEWGYRKNEYNG